MGLVEALGAGAARLLFYPSLLYTVARARLPGSRRPWFHRIDEVVLLGALPLRGRIRGVSPGIAVVSPRPGLSSLSVPAQEWESMGVEQLRLSTVDLTGVPTLENLHKGVEFILRHRACGNSVYVHCKAGRSRSATMVAAYLIQLHHWSPQEAIEAIAKIRPHILIRHKQVQVLEKFHRNMITGTTA
ncbi:phosphatidylglycerophosphatase and protein-tyrosine phosphatase 1 isoform X1 [Camarhynchus parvulus]|uniref:phosphatidylglycerophosphatase and protein-tyrosine phosphatase 1 isoform X1 n=1 Tax=Geospiza parvula TaxID=87175 RepID=UPI001237E09E|nr:phosphatidylglycerophosphatase and protein-tyrosine phosphatase 1 isoform X1 [Camarhynchus parvulus]